MGDTQLAPSSPSSGLSNGTNRLREGSTEIGTYDSQASSSSMRLDSSVKQTPSSSQRRKANGTISANSPSIKKDEHEPTGLVNGGLSAEEQSGSTSVSNGILNRLKDSQMRSSAPPSSSLSRTANKSTRRSARTSDLESGSSPRSSQPKSKDDRMQLIRQTRSTSPLPPPGQSNELPASNTDVEKLALNQKEQNLFRVKASDESSQILPPPPQLPFDAGYPGLATNGLDAKGNPIPIVRREEIAKQLIRMSNRDKNAKQSPIREIKTEVDQQFTPLDSNSRSSSAIVREMEDRESSAVGNDEMGVDTEHGDTTLNGAKSVTLASAEEDGNDSPARVTISEDVDQVLDYANTSIVSDNGLTNGSRQTPNKTSSSARSNRRKRPSEVEVLDQSFNNMSAADLSTDSLNSASSRRPREAHKRLKMIGGYYGKNAKPPSPPDSLAERAEETNDQINAQSTIDESVNGSRAASSTLEEAGPVPLTATTVTTADEDLLAQAIAADASFATPIKASQQPTMTINLRNSASKNQSTKMTHAGSGLIDNGGENNEHCETCNGAGHFICCDGCPRSFHFACINPPMDIDELPGTMGDEDDKWYCNVCKTEKEYIKSEAPSIGKNAGSKSKEKAKANANGIGAARFQPLFTYLDQTNPTIFALPLEIRNYFKGVATAADGSYVDSNMLRPLKINRLGVVEERDPLRLKDKNGKLILCFKCGESALPSERPSGQGGRKTNQPRRSSPRKATDRQSATDTVDGDHIGWRKIISCDFCALHWHLDCLEPPMASMPSLSRKWMCPAHVDHAVRAERIPKSIANSTTVHTLPVPSEKSIGPGKHYRTRVVNDGRIDIIPDPMDTYFVAPQNDKSGKQNEEKSTQSLASSVTGSGDQRGRGFDKGWEELDIPNTSTSVATNASQKTNSSSSKNLKFKYRIPEKVIRLDFWSRAQIERERAFSRFLQHAHEDVQRPLDILASIANAESLALDASDQSKDERGGEVDAKRSVEQIFGSQYARTLFPDLDLSTDIVEDDKSKIDGELESGLRQTFVPGVYEEEFDQRSLAMVTPALTPPAAVIELTERMREAKVAADRMNAENSASAMEVDVDELSKLRAIKALVDRRGAKALLDFLLAEEEGKKE